MDGFQNLSPDELNALMEGFEAEAEKQRAAQDMQQGRALQMKGLTTRSQQPGNRAFGKQLLEGFIPAAMGGYWEYRGRQAEKASNEKAQAASRAMMEVMRRGQMFGSGQSEQQAAPAMGGFRFPWE